MKRNIWKCVLAAGTIPFLIPIVLGVIRMQIESWTMGEWLILYSFVYWPTYLIGLVLILVAVYKLVDPKQKEEGEC